MLSGFGLSVGDSVVDEFATNVVESDMSRASALVGLADRDGDGGSDDDDDRDGDGDGSKRVRGLRGVVSIP